MSPGFWNFNITIQNKQNYIFSILLYSHKKVPVLNEFQIKSFQQFVKASVAQGIRCCVQHLILVPLTFPCPNPVSGKNCFNGGIVLCSLVRKLLVAGSFRLLQMISSPTTQLNSNWRPCYFILSFISFTSRKEYSPIVPFYMLVGVLHLQFVFLLQVWVKYKRITQCLQARKLYLYI